MYTTHNNEIEATNNEVEVEVLSPAVLSPLYWFNTVNRSGFKAVNPADGTNPSGGGVPTNLSTSGLVFFCSGGAAGIANVPVYKKSLNTYFQHISGSGKTSGAHGTGSLFQLGSNGICRNIRYALACFVCDFVTITAGAHLIYVNQNISGYRFSVTHDVAGTITFSAVLLDGGTVYSITAPVPKLGIFAVIMAEVNFITGVMTLTVNDITYITAVPVGTTSNTTNASLSYRTGGVYSNFSSREKHFSFYQNNTGFSDEQKYLLKNDLKTLI